MKAESSLFGILTLFVMHTLVLSAAAGPSSGVQVALKHAGGNRSELESGLREVNGNDTEYLIAHASQYDLVNLTTAQIIENVTYARKVHVALPYLGAKLNEELWRDWVLPHRVVDEDLCLWRKDLYEQMQPVVAGKKSVREVVEAVHGWLMEGDADAPARLVFGHSENRCKTPMQMLKIGKGACGDLSMMMVYLLRAVGIPARHCLTNWRFDGDFLHYYCEYWDSQVERWIPLDASDNKPLNAPVAAQEKTKTQRLGALTFFAHPGFPKVRDCYHIACFDQCLTVTAQMFDTYNVGFVVPAGFSGVASAYVWNTGAWRAMARGAVGKVKGSAMEFADALESAKRPVLFTATDGKTLWWGLQQPSAKAGKVELKQAVPGECLRWSSYGRP